MILRGARAFFLPPFQIKNGRVDFQQIARARIEGTRYRFEAGPRISLSARLDLRDGPYGQAGPLRQNLHLHTAEFPPLTDVHKALLICAPHFSLPENLGA